VYNGHALGTLTTLGVVLLSAAATVCQPHVLLLYLDRPCDSVVLAAHAQGSSLRGCAWFHVVEGCTGHVGGQPAHLSLAHGCHHTIVVPSPTAGRQAPPRTTSHARARKCSVQQSFDPPTCGSLYRGHWCTMGTRWAPSLHLVLCCLVPLPPCANRTYYYYIWTVGGVLAAHTQGSSLRGCAWFHVVEGCTGHVGGQPSTSLASLWLMDAIAPLYPSPTTGRRAPPGTVSHVRARKCRVQQYVDAPTCGSLYRGHSCTMGTHWAPSLCLVLCACHRVPPHTCTSRIWTVGGVLAAHTQGSSLRGCAWFHVVEGCTGHVGGQPSTSLAALWLMDAIAPLYPSLTAGRRAPPGTTSHACARMCRVQQSFDAPTCGSLYRGHWCTMGTHLAPSLFLVLVCLVPLPLRANRTYYYYIWTVRATRWCWLHTLRAHL
jgi:hypothetical protein